MWLSSMKILEDQWLSWLNAQWVCMNLSKRNFPVLQLSSITFSTYVIWVEFMRAYLIPHLINSQINHPLSDYGVMKWEESSVIDFSITMIKHLLVAIQVWLTIKSSKTSKIVKNMPLLIQVSSVISYCQIQLMKKLRILVSTKIWKVGQKLRRNLKKCSRIMDLIINQCNWYCLTMHFLMWCVFIE